MDFISSSFFRFRKPLLMLGLLGIVGGGTSCTKDDAPDEEVPIGNPPATCASSSFQATPYTLDIPFFFPTPIIPADNQMSVEGVALGRDLFWEQALSRDNSISCGSCHSPSTAFSDDVPFSTGIYGIHTKRNSMALVNLAWNTSFFWDGRAHTLEEQILIPVSHPEEMDLSWPEASAKIGEMPAYQEKFTAAFGTPCVDSVRITKAIAQFIRTMISADSRFDRQRFEGGSFTPAEYRGLELFLAEAGDPDVFPGGQNGGDCFHCHGGALIEFTDHGFHNNGLDAVITDLGLGAITGFFFDEGAFKTPTLRNIALSAPYMHDGRFATLRDVVEHYNSGGHASPTLDPLMKMQGVGLGLTETDKDDLVLFLESLTDTTFVNNPAFADPH